MAFCACPCLIVVSSNMNHINAAACRTVALRGSLSSDAQKSQYGLSAALYDVSVDGWIAAWQRIFIPSLIL